MHEPILGIQHMTAIAGGHSWYPYSFLAPIEQNQPWLSSVLNLPVATVKRATAAGIALSKLAVAGFSQHTINQDEIEQARNILSRLVEGS